MLNIKNLTLVRRRRPQPPHRQPGSAFQVLAFWTFISFWYEEKGQPPNQGARGERHT